MNKKSRTFIAVIGTIVLIAVIVALVVLNFKFGDTPNPLEEVLTTTTESVSTTEETPTQAVTEAPTEAPTAEPVTEDEEQTHSAADNYGNPNVQTITINEDEWYLTLVNRDRRLPDGYEPKLAPAIEGSPRQLDERCVGQYTAMYNAAKADGCDLTPFSGYRSISLQQRNYENKINRYLDQGYSYLDAARKAATIILPPGTSEHNLGLAMDIRCADNWFEDTKEFDWLMEHAQDYGFILRYPKDKQDITKITYEPWHWRYVGVEAAKAMKASGQCLEEYLGYA